MKRKKFKIVSKPIKPVRKKGVEYCLNYIDRLSGIISWAEDLGADVNKVVIKTSYGCYDGDVEAYASVCIDEIKSDFDKRVLGYKKRKAVYDKWCKKNKEEIKKELAIRTQEAKVKEKARLEREKKQQEKEKIKLEKKLKQLTAELKKMK